MLFRSVFSRSYQSTRCLAFDLEVLLPLIVARARQLVVVPSQERFLDLRRHDAPAVFQKVKGQDCRAALPQPLERRNSLLVASTFSSCPTPLRRRRSGRALVNRLPIPPQYGPSLWRASSCRCTQKCGSSSSLQRFSSIMTGYVCAVTPQQSQSFAPCDPSASCS